MTSVRYAFRTLFKSPGFTIVAILTIAMGIGANTALFSIFNTLVLHPIQLPDAGKLVRIWTNNTVRNVVAPVISVPKYRIFEEQQTVFGGIAASAFNAVALTRDGSDPEQFVALNVSGGFIPTLGLRLAHGRNFTPDEEVQNGPHVCILPYEIWRSHFGQRDNIVGQTIVIDGVGTTVVGVLAAALPAPIAPTQIFMPWPFNPPYLTQVQLDAGAGFLQITARLKPGTTFEQAASQIKGISARYQKDSPGRVDGNNENELRTWIEEQVGPVRPTLLLLVTAVAFVLLIACANVSNLFLGRLSARHKEIAVRLSLGAKRSHLVRQFLLETLIFCIIAATLGVILAAWSLHAAEALLAAQQQVIQFPLDALTLSFTVGISVLSSLVIGFIPAIKASNVDLSSALKDNSRGTIGGARGTRFRAFLIVSEVALSAALLVGSGLLLLSFSKLQSTPPGFSTKGVASVFVNAPAGRYPTPKEQADFYARVIERLRSNPQIKFAASTWALPLVGNIGRGTYAIDGRPVPTLAERPVAYMDAVTDDLFKMLQIPLKQGRFFTTTDVNGSLEVCIINESLAKRLWPNESAVGHYLLRGKDAEVKLEIVGVVSDVKSLGLNVPAPEIIYFPVQQRGGGFQTLVAQTDGDPNTLQPILTAAVASVDKSLAVSGFGTMELQVQQSLGVQRITAWLTGAFAAMALLLSALGLYSVLAYLVTQRTGEIGVRMALGATQKNVIQLILGQGMKLVLIGLVVGLGVSAAGSRVITSLLYNVGPLDPGIFGGVAVLFALVAVLACLIPSWRASRIEALVALRSD